MISLGDIVKVVFLMHSTVIFIAGPDIFLSDFCQLFQIIKHIQSFMALTGINTN